MPAAPLIEITYCRLCGWGLRAGWMAQELLTTFAEEVGSVVLTPDASGGVSATRPYGPARTWAAFLNLKSSSSSCVIVLHPGALLVIPTSLDFPDHDQPLRACASTPCPSVRTGQVAVMVKTPSWYLNALCGYFFAGRLANPGQVSLLRH